MILEQREALAAFPFIVALVLVVELLRGTGRWRALGRAGVAGAGVGVVAFAIAPVYRAGWSFEFFPTLVPFRTIGAYLSGGLHHVERVQIFGNIALLAPAGMLLPLAWEMMRRPAFALGTIALASLTVEVAQMFLPGHGPDVDDVLLNTLGGALGFGLFRAIRAVLHERLDSPT